MGATLHALKVACFLVRIVAYFFAACVLAGYDRMLLQTTSQAAWQGKPTAVQTETAVSVQTIPIARLDLYYAESYHY